jgi:hypothetical protein
MLERNGESEPAVRDMPFVPGDRLRTENGRVEIQFPDGTAIEIGEYSLVEAVTPSRVRLLAGTMDHIPGRAAEAGTATSAAYLPQDLQTYGDTFDRYGSWQYSAPHGYVWYPTVAPGWRPYYYGSWSPVPSYGWTWIGIDAWSWPTHHYGRWGYGRNAWYWIPGRTWGAAWVSWAAAPDYVSWCPLGYDGRPVFGLSVIAADFGSRYRDHGWNGWTVLSRRQFGARGSYANRDAVEPRQLPSNTPFIVQSRAPVALPHQTAAGRQSSVATRQSSVGSRQSPADSRQSPVGSHQSAPNRAPVIGSAIERGQTIPPLGTGNGRVPSQERRRATEDWRLTTSRAAAPRVNSPRAAAPPPEFPQAAPATEYRRAMPEYRRPATEDRRLTTEDWRLTTPRAAAPRAAAPPAAAPPAAAPRAAPPSYQSPFYRQAPGLEPPRIPPAYAIPRAGASPPPLQRAPAAAPITAGAPLQAPAASPAPPHSRASPAGQSAPQGAAREGTARARSGGDGQPAGARRPR